MEIVSFDNGKLASPLVQSGKQTTSIIASELPFDLDQDVMDIWGKNPNKEQLSQQIAKQGFRVEYPLLLAQIGDARPLIYDGLTRLEIWFDRKASGINEPFPTTVIDRYENKGQVLDEVLKVQNARRNVTAAEVAIAALKIKRFQGYAIVAQPQGRPRKANALALKPLPDAKELAKEFGVSDFTIRTVLSAQKHPEILERLASKDDENALSIAQANRQIKGFQRDVDAHNAKKLTRKRRAALAKMKVEAAPEAIIPDGIFTGDFNELMKRIQVPPKTPKLIFTSIPYACNVEYDVTEAFDGDLPKYLDTFVRQLFLRAKEIFEPGDRIAINFDNTYRSIEKQSSDTKHAVSHQYNMVKEIGKIAEDELGFKMLGYRTWYKQNCPNYFAHGSRNSRTPIDNPNTEFIYIWGLDSTTLEGESDITLEEYDQFAITHWYIAPQTRHKRHLNDEEFNPDFHPVPFPEELAYRIIKMYSPKDAVVIDPFSGSGTTAFVAHALGRSYIGLDNSELYNASARKRLATLDGLTPKQKLDMITRFVPAGRTDGFVKHCAVKPKNQAR